MHNNQCSTALTTISAYLGDWYQHSGSLIVFKFVVFRLYFLMDIYIAVAGYVCFGAGTSRGCNVSLRVRSKRMTHVFSVLLFCWSNVGISLTVAWVAACKKWLL